MENMTTGITSKKNDIQGSNLLFFFWFVGRSKLLGGNKVSGYILNSTFAIESVAR
jgi:hypothetical protein